MKASKILIYSRTFVSGFLQLWSLVFLLALTDVVIGVPSHPWIHPSYQARVLIKELSNVGNAPQMDFPVLICLSNQPWLSDAQAGGRDITFAGIDGQQLFHEIEYLDGAAGNLVAWVCLPSFTNRTQIYLYYNNTSGIYPFSGSNSTLVVSTNLTNLNDPFLVSNTWNDQYEQVYHFNEASGLFKDSSRYGNHVLSVDGNIRYGSNGIAGRGIWSTGSNGLKGITTASPSGVKNRSNSVSLWFAQGSATPYSASFTHLLNYPGIGWRIMNGRTNSRGIFMNWTQSTEIPLSSEWVWMAQFQFLSPTNISATTNYGYGYFTNGVVNHSKNGTVDVSAIDFSANGNFFGAYASASMWGAPVGWMDEFRESKSIRSTNWLLCEYSNTVWSRKGNLCDTPESSLAPSLTYPSNNMVETNNWVSFQWTHRDSTGLSGYEITILTNGSPCLVVTNGVSMTLTTNLAPYLGSVSTNAISWWVSTLSLSGATVRSTTNQATFLFHPRVRTVLSVADSSGKPLSGALVRYSSPTNGYDFTDGNGQLTLFGQLARANQTFKITPRGVGGAELLVTNLLIPDRDSDFEFVVTFPGQTREPDRGAASSNSSIYCPGSGKGWTVSIPTSWDSLGRLVGTLQSLSGGLKFPVLDLFMVSGVKDYPLSTGGLQSQLTPGLYILELRYQTPRMDQSQEKVIRQMIMVVK